MRFARRKFIALSSVFGPVIVNSVDKKLALLTMQRAPLQKRIELNFFQPPRRPEAFLIARSYVDRRSFTFFFRFCAFKNDDVSGHVENWLRSICVCVTLWEGGNTTLLPWQLN